MPVTEVINATHLDQLLRDAGDKLVVVHCSAFWSLACRKLNPFIRKLSEQYNWTADFIKFEIREIWNDDLWALTMGEAFGVRVVPTFVFMWREREVDRLQSDDPETISAKIADLCAQPRPNPPHRRS